MVLWYFPFSIRLSRLQEAVGSGKTADVFGTEWRASIGLRHWAITRNLSPRGPRALSERVSEKWTLVPLAYSAISSARRSIQSSEWRVSLFVWQALRAKIVVRERVMAMKIDRIQPAGMNVRMQQGKPAYSHVVTVTGPGKTIYIAGQLARDAEGNIVGPGDMRAQVEQTFKNLDACLKAAGATWADVVKTTVFLHDMATFPTVNEVYARWIGDARPARSTRSSIC